MNNNIYKTILLRISFLRNNTNCLSTNKKHTVVIISRDFLKDFMSNIIVQYYDIRFNDGPAVHWCQGCGKGTHTKGFTGSAVWFDGAINLGARCGRVSLRGSIYGLRHECRPRFYALDVKWAGRPALTEIVSKYPHYTQKIALVKSRECCLWLFVAGIRWMNPENQRNECSSVGNRQHRLIKGAGCEAGIGHAAAALHRGELSFFYFSGLWSAFCFTFPHCICSLLAF